MQNKPDQLNDFSKVEVLGIIGEGSFSAVYMANYQNKPAVLKLPDVESPEGFDIFQNELNICLELARYGGHPCVLSLMAYCSGAYLDECCLLLERMQCDLYDWLCDNNFGTWQQRISFFYDTLCGVHYLHSLGLIHCDLKLENLLVDSHERIKICDFGFAQKTNTDGIHRDKNIFGSAPFVAPEIWSNGEYSKYSDIYALSLILYTFLEQKTPYLFPDHTPWPETDIETFVTTGDRLELSRSTDNESTQIRMLIQIMWAQNKNTRPDTQGLLQNSLFAPLLQGSGHLRETLPLTHEKRSVSNLMNN